MLTPFLTLDLPCDRAATRICEALIAAGWHPRQTFDLQLARAGHPDCPCPHHGTEQCTCQFVVLLIYGEWNEPLTLVLHGQEGRSWVSWTNTPLTAARQRVEAVIQMTLVPA